MISFQRTPSENVLHVKATGKLTHADYQRLIPKLEDQLRSHGKLRVLFELDDCQGWEIGAAWDDLKFGLKHGGDCERCAVVGQKRWQRWMTKLAKPFFAVRYFDKSQMPEAWDWILEGVPAATESAGG